MKNKLISLLAAVVLLLAVNIPTLAKSAVTEYFELNIPEGYTVISVDNAKEYKEYLEGRGFSVNSFKNYITENGIILYATDTKASEIVITSFKADFANQIGDLYHLNTEDINKFAPELLGQREYDILDYEHKNRFIKCIYSGQDNGGSYLGVQLITVKNSTVYTVNFTGDANVGLSDEALAQVLNSLKFRITDTNPAKTADNIITVIFLALTVLAFFEIAAYIIYTFIADYKLRKNQSDVAPYVVIKRRKF